MKWKSSFRVSLFSVWCLAIHSKLVTSATTTAETLPAESTTVVAGILDSETWKYPKLCYVKKSTVNELITRMNQTVQILNRKDAYLKCNEKVEAAVVEADDIDLCDDDRILRIQKDLSEVAAGLFQLAIRLSEPSEEDVLSLDRKKFQLVYDLKALRVFYGPSPCNENSIALYPFQPLVEYVEWNLDQVFVLFQTTRPTRPSPTTTTTSTFPSTTPKPNEEDMLSPHASFVELTEMAHFNPNAMSRALPRIVSQRYNEKVSTFDKLLNFTESLPTTENNIFGVSAIYDEMYRYNQNPEPGKLIKMAKTVKTLNETVKTSPDDTSSATSKLADLMENLSPLTLIGEKAECKVSNVAYQLQLAAEDYTSPYSAYLASDSTFRFQVYPKVKDGRLVFRIDFKYVSSRLGPFYASDNNPNTNPENPKYQTQPSERYVLYHWNGPLPSDEELDWKIVPIENKTNQFKILSAKFDDFMFAHQSATGYNNWRRVLLGRKSYSSHDHIPEADNWTFDCKPGNFTIPAN